jgi:hypothetical protein
MNIMNFTKHTEQNKNKPIIKKNNLTTEDNISKKKLITPSLLNPQNHFPFMPLMTPKVNCFAPQAQSLHNMHPLPVPPIINSHPINIQNNFQCFGFPQHMVLYPSAAFESQRIRNQKILPRDFPKSLSHIGPINDFVMSKNEEINFRNKFINPTQTMFSSIIQNQNQRKMNKAGGFLY